MGQTCTHEDNVALSIPKGSCTQEHYETLLTDEQILGLKKQFATYDSDRNGKITLAELKNVMSEMGHNPTKAELKCMFKAVDTDGSGSIDQTEYLNMMALKLKEGPTEREMRGGFRLFDKDGNGFITVSELRQVMKSLGGKYTVEEADKMIRRFDVDGDGQINYEEFIKMMAR